MGLALIIAAVFGWWLHRRGELLPQLRLWAGVGAALIIGAKLLEGGKVLPALLVAAAGYGWWRMQVAKPARLAADEAAALALLGLAPGAGRDAIQLAWRSSMASAHPDAGGSAAAVQRLTAARDLLLARR